MNMIRQRTIICTWLRSSAREPAEIARPKDTSLRQHLDRRLGGSSIDDRLRDHPGGSLSRYSPTHRTLLFPSASSVLSLRSSPPMVVSTAPQTFAPIAPWASRRASNRKASSPRSAQNDSSGARAPLHAGSAIHVISAPTIMPVGRKSGSALECVPERRSSGFFFGAQAWGGSWFFPE